MEEYPNTLDDLSENEQEIQKDFKYLKDKLLDGLYSLDEILQEPTITKEKIQDIQKFCKPFLNDDYVIKSKKIKRKVREVLINTEIILDTRECNEMNTEIVE